MFSLDEVGLIPAVLSKVNHRSDVNPYVTSEFGEQKLPVFVSPMTCILDSLNITKFLDSKVEPIYPVSFKEAAVREQLLKVGKWKGWIAVTLQEFFNWFSTCKMPEDNIYHVLIDVANGHMSDTLSIIKDAKQEYGDHLVVMLGNIANPRTYIDYCEAGIDYVRVGIGGGNGCTTSVQTGIHTSLPYLLSEISSYKNSLEKFTFETKIIADGGIDTIGKAIKALALGADYVMMGKCFAQCEEACGQIFEDENSNKVREYYGQASKQGQIDRFGKVKSNPEGTLRYVEVNDTLENFTNQFEAALRSAMSYCNAMNLSEFIGKVQYKYMSPNEFTSYNK